MSSIALIWPVSSPTSIICVTIGGKIGCCTSGADIGWPSRTDFCTSFIASPMTALPVVPPTTSSACITGTPTASKVPRLRENRLIAIFVNSVPNTGSRSLNLSNASRHA